MIGFILCVGQYKKRFTEPGLYYVWSGYVDRWGIKNYAGTIKVENAESSLAEINVKIGGKEALHEIGGKNHSVFNIIIVFAI
jgi:hypothetical protein